MGFTDKIEAQIDRNIGKGDFTSCGISHGLVIGFTLDQGLNKSSFQNH